jgi:hypothetical protein
VVYEQLAEQAQILTIQLRIISSAQSGLREPHHGMRPVHLPDRVASSLIYPATWGQELLAAGLSAQFTHDRDQEGRPTEWRSQAARVRICLKHNCSVSAHSGTDETGRLTSHAHSLPLAPSMPFPTPPASISPIDRDAARLLLFGSCAIGSTGMVLVFLEYGAYAPRTADIGAG